VVSENKPPVNVKAKVDSGLHKEDKPLVKAKLDSSLHEEDKVPVKARVDSGLRRVPAKGKTAEDSTS
jgi:hypothetical protein